MTLTASQKVAGAMWLGRKSMILSIDCLLKEISGDGYVRDLAISLAHLCFRNGPVEDMHAEGKLDDTDMMELNKYMVDHLGLFLLLLGLSDFSSLKRILWFHDQCGSDWDSPDVQKMLHDYHISTDRLKALAFNRDPGQLRAGVRAIRLQLGLRA